VRLLTIILGIEEVSRWSRIPRYRSSSTAKWWPERKW